MTTDLDERITRSLTARADGIAVTRPPLDDVLAGTGAGAAASAPGGGGRRRTAVLAAAAVVALLVASAAVALATRTDDGDVVDVRPADDPTTTAPTPGLGLGHVPPGLPPEPQVATGLDGTTVLTYGDPAGSPALEVAVVPGTRTPELEAALDARDTEAIVAAYAAGGSIPTDGDGPATEGSATEGSATEGPAGTPPGEEQPATPLGDAAIGEPAALADEGRAHPVLAHSQPGDDPLLVVVDRSAAPGTALDLGLVAFRAGAEVRLAGRGIRLDDALGALRSLVGPGVDPRPRPEAPPLTAAPVPAGTSFQGPAVTDLPEGWALDGVWGIGGAYGGEDVVVDGATVGADVASATYAPAGTPDGDPADPFQRGPLLTVSVSRSTPRPDELAALDSGDDEELFATIGLGSLRIWAGGSESRVLRIDELTAVATTGVVDGSTVDGADRHELTWVVGYVGAELRLEAQAEGLTDDELVAALRSLVLTR